MNSPLLDPRVIGLMVNLRLCVKQLERLDAMMRDICPDLPHGPSELIRNANAALAAMNPDAPN